MITFLLKLLWRKTYKDWIQKSLVKNHLRNCLARVSSHQHGRENVQL